MIDFSQSAATSHRRPFASLSARAFTLVEILVAMAIISILTAMLFIGAKTVLNHTREKATRVTLEKMLGLITPMEAYKGKDFIAQVKDGSGNPVYAWTNSGGVIVYTAIPAPTDVSYDAFRAGIKDRHGDAVKATQNLIGALRAVPDSRDLISRFPNNDIMRQPTDATDEGQAMMDPPVVLDGWGNPIIFIPGGMSNVTVGPSTDTKMSPDSKGYFVSAGPDGKFNTGDDNIYSFQH